MLEMRNITKRFGDFTANDSLNLTVFKGEIHALLGENGAGKTTLMKILYGLYSPCEGEIFVDNEKVNINHTDDAISLGIGMVHQHFMLIPTFTVTQNIILGREPTKSFNRIDFEKATKQVKDISEKYKLTIDPDVKIQDLSVGMQQRVEILKALYRGAEILILDEPTAVLTPQEVLELESILRSLAAVGKSIIIITHKLKEIKMMANRCTIIRRGKLIDVVDVDSVTENELASKMVGRHVNFCVDKKEIEEGNVVLELKDVKARNNRGIMALNGINLEIKRGEILGIAGIDGNGQTELVEVLNGIREVENGEIIVNQHLLTNSVPKKIIDSGICFIPEDRQKRGLILQFSLQENLILHDYDKPKFSKGINLKYKDIEKHAYELLREFDVRPVEPKISASSLSGGNQQKLIIAREISDDPEVLIASQPTRGLDVGAIEFVYKALVSQRDKYKAVVLVSFELDEILALSDRIAVIYEGKIVGIIDGKEANENDIGLMMSSGRCN